MTELLIVPFGGLANRLRVVFSALAMAEAHNMKTRILWIQRKEELNCSFEALFMPICNCRVTSLKDNFFWRVLIKVAREKSFSFAIFNNLLLGDRFIKRHFEGRYFDLNEEDVVAFMAKRKRKTNVIISCGKFYPYSTNESNKIVITENIQQKVDNFLQRHFLRRYVAMHIRQTDNVVAIENSPLQLFIDKIKENIEAGSRIVVCTDSELVENNLFKLFGHQVIFVKGIKDRDSSMGIQNALLEIVLLSKADRIYGSFGSTFSLTAAELGNGNLEVLKKP